MPVTLQSPLQDQAVARLSLAWLRSLPSLASPPACCQLCPRNTFLINHVQQVLLPGSDSGRHWPRTQTLFLLSPCPQERSAKLERLTNHKLGNTWFARTPFGKKKKGGGVGSARFVWKDVLINSLRAKLITYGHEYCWCQGFKRRGWCSAWSHERDVFVPQSRRWRHGPGMEGRPGAVWCLIWCLSSSTSLQPSVQDQRPGTEETTELS